MGCVSSKLLKEQASLDDGSRAFPHKISARLNNSTTSTTQYYHRHCVSLTSTSYGFMKADPPIATSHKKKKSEKGVGGIGTLTEMYGKLSSLEMNDVIRNKSQIRSNRGSSTKLNVGSPEYAISESINVGDMMMGLEEAAPLSSASASSFLQIRDESIDGFGPNSNTSTPTKPKRRQTEHQRPDKKKLRVLKDMSELVLDSAEVDKDDNEEVGKENSIPNIAKVASKPIKGPRLLRKESIASNRFLCSNDNGVAPLEELSPSKPHTMAMMIRKYSVPYTPPSVKQSRFASGKVNLVSCEPTSPLFDPDLVASYEEALENLSGKDWDSHHKSPIRGLDNRIYNPLECFEAKCPPGGDNKVIIYTTTLRGIRKTFENCNVARGILQDFGITMDERDVSMHLEYLNELKELMGKVVSVPRIFIKGRYIGGTDELGKLHEDGRLSELLEGLPKDVNKGDVCDGCGGVRFVPCLECNGSCKVRQEDNRVSRCPECNENGLIQCPICT